MKVLITYASCGAGHKRAADAIFTAFKNRAGQDEVSLVNSLDYTQPFFKWLYQDNYLFMANRLPSIWGFFYYLFDFRPVDFFIKKGRLFLYWLFCRGFLRFLEETKPDVLVCTHFFASEWAAYLKAKGKVACRIVCVVTDFKFHLFWLAEHIDEYTVASEETKQDLLRRKIPAEKIHVLGIPVLPQFAIKMDKAGLREKFRLDKDAFTLLVMSGGFGVGPVIAILKALEEIKKHNVNLPQTIIICGRNPRLFAKIKKMKLSLPHLLLEFVDNVYEYMQAADCLITKAGGLTLSEALAEVLVPIIIAPIPGQESRNSELLLKYQAAFVAKNPRRVREIVLAILKRPEMIEEKRKNIRSLSRPQSASEITQLILKR
jgi:processive 1,2-diacylglycerol beta-glucosyltransferase